MPVLTLARSSGLWLVLDPRPSLACLLLDLLVGIGMASVALRLLWRPRSGRKPRRRRAARLSLADR
jgi:hypothetical protein